MLAQTKTIAVDGFLDLLPLKPGAVQPRPYQLEMARALYSRGNTLVVMPTALGKTFVAILASAIMFAQKKDARILVLAPTKPLVLQQAKRFADTLAVDSVEAITGEISPQKRAGKWSAQVVVSTPQTALADLLSRKLNVKDYSLVVFDEAHRAVGDYAYSFLGRQFVASGAKILALTASPSSQRDKIDEIRANLGIAHVEIRSESDPDVAPFINKLKLDWEFVDLPGDFVAIKKLLEEMLRDAASELKKAGFLETADLTKVTSRSLLEARIKILAAVQGDPANYKALSSQARAMNLTHAIGLLESQGVGPLKTFLEELKTRKQQSKAVAAVAADPRTWKALELCKLLVERGVEHPKMHALREIVSQSVAKNQSVIVFAHYRDTVSNLVASLNAIDGVSALALVGKSDSGMSQKKQAEVIERFRNKDFNVLVASSVGEEGLDIPAVDLVVFFEPVPSEIRSIQRRGRAGRTHSGRVMILVAKGTRDEAFFWIARRKERVMKETLEGIRGPQATLEDF